MIIVEGFVRMENAGDFEKVRAAAEAQIASSRAEDGCIAYTYALNVLDPQIMRVLERWKSWEAVEAHFEMTHMRPWRAALAGAPFARMKLKKQETCKPV